MGPEAPWVASTFFLAGILVGIVGCIWSARTFFDDGGRPE